MDGWKKRKETETKGRERDGGRDGDRRISGKLKLGQGNRTNY